MAKKKAKGDQPAKPKSIQGRLCVDRDPRVYAERLPKLLPGHKRFAGLDLATNTGVAFCDLVPGQPVKAGTIIAGQWSLALSSYEGEMMRLVRLQQLLAALQPDLIAMEDNRYSGQAPGPGVSYAAIVARAVSAAEFLTGLKCTVGLWAEHNDVPLHSVSSTELKRFATGKGNSNKVDLIQAANVRFGCALEAEGYESTGADNIADAMWLCCFACELYAQASCEELT